MKAIVAFILASVALVDALADNCYRCKEDKCLKAVMGYGFPSRQGRRDCDAFLCTTVTLSARTVTHTNFVTVTPTVTVRTTNQVLVPTNTVTTEALVDTTTASETTSTTITTNTLTTSTTTTTTTSTTTTTNQQPAPVTKRDAKQSMKIAPLYATACRDETAYRKACSCIGAVPRTKTAPRQTVTATTVKTHTAAITETTTLTTPTSSTYVASTQTVLTTFSTEIRTAYISTDIVTEIDATISTTTTTTTSTTTTETASAPTQTSFALQIDYPPSPAPNPNKNNVHAKLASLGSDRYGISGTSDASSEDSFTLSYASGQVVASTSPGAGEIAYYSTSSVTSSFIFTTASDSGVTSNNLTPLVCSITSTSEFQCQWTATQTAALWMCNNVLYISSGPTKRPICGVGLVTAFRVSLLATPVIATT